MSGPWISPLQLPRSLAVTEALLAPAEHRVGAAEFSALAREFTESLSSAARGLPGRQRIDGYRLAKGAPISSSEPFAWSARTARRLIGLGGVAALVAAQASSPAEGVGIEERRLLDQTRSGSSRRGSLAEWLSHAEPGARAAVRAAAITWSTRLMCALEFDRLEGRASIGGPDRWWDCPGAPTVSLRGRCDVIASLSAGGPGSWSSFVMLGGRPGPSSRAELGLLALVAGLRSGTAGLPARAVGYWPDCGRTLVVATDLASLRASAAAVLAVVDRPGLRALAAVA